MSETAFERAIAGADDLVGADVVVPQAVGLEVGSSGARAEGQGPARQAAARPTTARALPHKDLSPLRRSFRHWFSRAVSALLMKSWFRITIVGRDRILREPALYVFNHLGWTDPIVMLAAFPGWSRLHFYGPKEADLRKGIRNRFMRWTTLPVPFSPDKNDLRTSVRRAQAVFDSGASLAISAEGRIHVHEGDLLPFEEGAAYLALRAGVPIVPVAITGTSWARFRGRVLIRIGEPIPTGDRPTRHAVARYTALAWHRLRAMVADDRDRPAPGPIARWVTDLFNDWGPGGRAAATQVHGPDPADVPIPTADG